jgi:hypothetical protein
MLANAVETVIVLIMCIISLMAGLRCSRCKTLLRTSLFFAAMCFIFYSPIARWIPLLRTSPILSFYFYGRNPLIFFSVALAFCLGIILPQIKTLRLKILFTMLIIVSLLRISAISYIGPVFVYQKHKNLETKLTPDGICLQQTNYNCGPASAVTALRSLGINAEISDVAIQSYSSPVCGTLEGALFNGVNKLYGDKVNCYLKTFKTIKEMQGHTPVIAAIKYNFLVNHFVAVIYVNDNEVAVGDPLKGLEILSYENFAKRWQFYGIAVKLKE